MSAVCAVGVAVLVYRDLAIPEVRDAEVWFGFTLRGRAALLTAPLHWSILAIGAWAFWTRRPWIALATALYLHSVALSHLIWSVVSPDGPGWPGGVLMAAFFSALAIPFWKARRGAWPR